MNYLNDKEAIERLHMSGCTAVEIERLRRLRREYAKESRASQDHHCPGYTRWLKTFLQLVRTFAAFEE